MLAIPIIRQAEEYSCGAASLASVLRYWGVWEGNEEELYKLTGTCSTGTLGRGIEIAAQSFGLVAYSRSNLTTDDLLYLLSAGKTIILSIQLDDYIDGEVWDEGHYVVLIGIYCGFIHLMDPFRGYTVMDELEFLECWHDYTDNGDRDWHSGIIIFNMKT